MNKKQQNVIELIEKTKRLSLLYVEDNEEARESTLNILREFFSDITVGHDGEDGLKKFLEKHIDLIIADINMPKMNGLEMLKEIKNIREDVLCLVFSAYNEIDFFIESIKIGVEGYLLKPLDLNPLVNMLTKVTQKIDVLQTKQQLIQYKDIVEHGAIISILGVDNKVKHVNDAFCKVSGYEKEELIGFDYHDVTISKQEKNLSNEIWKTIRTDKKIWKGVTKNIAKSGKAYYLDTIIKPILDLNGEIVEYMAMRYDITAIMSPLKQLNDIIDIVEEPMVVLIKIENFEDIENFYGQKIIQDIENSFAEQLLNFLPKMLRVKDIFALSDGEFAIALDKEECTLSTNQIANRLATMQETIEKAHINIGELDYDISVLISYAYGSQALADAKYGIKSLVDSKQNLIFSNKLAQKEYDKSLENIKVIKMVKIAIEKNKIISYFQPIVDNKTQKVVKYESLVRLVDENNKILAPFFFLEVSKKGKYYTQITSMVLDNSFAALALTDKDISINLSALDIEKEQIKAKLYSLLEEHKKDNHRIVIELLEEEEFKDFDVIKEFIATVKKLGVKIAIDDFGSGYSNFKRLLDYQPDILKIDATLVKNIATSSFSYSTVKTMVLFAKELNMEVIAEYVENEEIYDILCSLGVEYSQGYYFGKPEMLQKK